MKRIEQTRQIYNLSKMYNCLYLETEKLMAFEVFLLDTHFQEELCGTQNTQWSDSQADEVIMDTA